MGEVPLEEVNNNIPNLSKYEFLEGEDWKTIPGCSRYLISTKGRVYSFCTNKLLKMHLDKSGYYTLSVKDDNGKLRAVRVNRMVAQAFIPNPKNKPVVNHIDSDRTNNNVENLEWCTYQENNIHAAKRGRNHGNRKLTDEQVEQIQELYASDKYTTLELAEIFNVCVSTITRNVKRAINKNQKKNKGLSKETIEEIRKLYETGKFSQKQLADKFGISKSCITKHVSGIKGYESHKSPEEDKRFTCFTEYEKKAIRILYRSEKYSQRRLGEMFRTSPQTIREIVRDIDTNNKRKNRGLKIIEKDI